MCVFLVVGLILIGTGATSRERMAVAGAYGKLQGFLESSNYAAAYRLLSSDVRSQLKLETFSAVAAKRSFSDTFRQNISSSSFVKFSGNTAMLHIKYSESFGTAFIFVHEDEGWFYANKTFQFEN